MIIYFNYFEELKSLHMAFMSAIKIFLFFETAASMDYHNMTSQDKTVNERGIDLNDFCKQTGFVILNGRTGEDAGVGKFTCVATNGCIVVDYILCKKCDYELFKKFVVGSPTVYSDHCQIEFDINVHCIPPTDVDNSNKTKKYEWDDEYNDAFISNLNDTDTVDRFVNLLSSIDHTADNDCIDELVVYFTT